MRKINSITPAQINIVPLLDVLLVLVAVLLLLTPFMAKSINVDLPSMASGAVMTQDTAVTVEIHADGTYWHDHKQIDDWSAFAQVLKGATTAKVFADKNATYGAVAMILDKLAANDVHNIQFAARD